MSRTLIAILALTTAAACSAAATPPAAQSPQTPSQAQIVNDVADRLADASARMGVAPSANAAGAAEAQPAQYVSAALSCEIRATPTRDGVRLESFAYASGPLTGSYDLIVTKSGPDGSSDINQSGDFDTLSESSASLGESEISLERGARLHARLSVQGDNGAECWDELRS